MISHRYFSLCLEVGLAVLLLSLAMSFSTLGSRWFCDAERLISQLVRRPRLAILLVMFVALAGRMAVLPLIGIPAPFMHDEFSYLLAGQTFAAGRVTNKPHPMWAHFESLHILQQPTYMSMYQPAQGVVLALGDRIAWHAWVGVWFSVILMSGAICWALLAWLPAEWALVGGLLTVVRWGLFSYWVNSYWGGAVPALAGALVIGSLPRLLRHSRVRDALILGLGFALLANSRPYEGLVLGATATVVFLAWSLQRGWGRRILRARLLCPLGLLLGLTAAGILYYDHQITGRALLLPYIADRQQYAVAPLFLWESLRPKPKYHSPSMRHVYLAEVKVYQRGKASWGLPEMLRKLKDFWLFFAGPLLTIPLLSLYLARDERTKFFLLLLGAIMIALLAEVWFYPHYGSPSLCVVVALVLQGMRRLRPCQWRGKPAGIFLVRTIPIAVLLMGVVPVSAAALGLQLSYWPLQWYGGTPDIVQPVTLTSRFRTEPRSALVIVRYGPTHDEGDEWVYNAANIEDAPVVWARETDPGQNAALIRYFHDRSVWLFEPDKHPWVLHPYSVVSEPHIPATRSLH